MTRGEKRARIKPGIEMKLIAGIGIGNFAISRNVKIPFPGQRKDAARLISILEPAATRDIRWPWKDRGQRRLCSGCQVYEKLGDAAHLSRTTRAGFHGRH